ncbi:hypothetical protein [Neobacillus ginsengisoli]|uniref:Uncharacterized protein n=1 Tax=Neobacillus ginsengisoli TaxID=904295 RepID=A0ABT9Y2N9_9BACI|nr:hypothetical protein [Neobacillus ginsengisoli]MDQ0202090.1 hypothetical protein [Neobacillus ginsengisoli]
MKPLGAKEFHFIDIYHLCWILYIVDKSTITLSQLCLMLHKKVGVNEPLTQLNGPKHKEKAQFLLQNCAL